jgi:probable F420-dependent oxidoreductase
MRIGVFLPISGRAAGPDTLSEAASAMESWGFDSIWAADRLIIPWTIETPYPYAEGDEFIVPPDRPFLETLTVLSYLSGQTKSIELGVSVLVLPYRHPLYWGKVVTTIDRLSKGRFILGVGVGWMREEFEALGAEYRRRGVVTDEQLELWQQLLTEEHASFDGAFYRFDDIAFEPKADTGRIPLWIGGEGVAARRRAAQFGDAWFPYHVEITADQLAADHADVKRRAGDMGRTADEVALCACRPVEVTEHPVDQLPGKLAGTPDQLLDAIRDYEKIGVETLALQFMVPRYPDRMRQIERFATEVLDHFE